MNPQVFIDATHKLWDGVSPNGEYNKYSCYVVRDFSKRGPELAFYRNLIGDSTLLEGGFFCSMADTGYVYEHKATDPKENIERQNVRFMFLYLAYLISKNKRTAKHFLPISTSGRSDGVTVSLQQDTGT